MKKTLKIVLVNNAVDAKQLVNEGFCPVECSFGEENVLGEYLLDHHGKMSYMESVAVRAYRDLYGEREHDPRFVINHIDADCIFAIAALAGLLPHKNHVKKFIAKEWEQDLLPLAKTVALVDTDPIGRDILSMPYGDVLVAWNALFGNGSKDELAAMAGVQGWITLLTSFMASTFVNAAKEVETNRVKQALLDLEERGTSKGNILAIYESRMFGFDVWYGRQPMDGSANEVQGWKHPIVISLVDGAHNVTFGCPNKEIAEQLFGEGGLKNVFNRLNEVYNTKGFGGREAIGGSPRNQYITQEEFEEYISIIDNMINC